MLSFKACDGLQRYLLRWMPKASAAATMPIQPAD
jgi:hypothetical protein